MGLLTQPPRCRVAVLGAGAWGTAFAVLAAGRHHVTLWARDAALAGRTQSERANHKYLPGVLLPAALAVTGDLDAALDGADILVSAVPASSLAAMLQRCRHRAADAPLLWLSKGFVAGGDGNAGKGGGGGGDGRQRVELPHQAVAAIWSAPSAVLSGPSFAIEVARGLPTAVTVAAADLATAGWFADRFRFDSFRTYASDDLIGVEVGGAVKNVLAIAAGIADGLTFGFNARAALITRGLAETGRLSEALGGRRDTLMGLSGLGDIVLTCTADLSRNRQVGLGLARGKPLDLILAELGHVAEGVATARRLHRLAAHAAIEMPIAASVHDVLFGGKLPAVAVGELLAREPRFERQ